MTMIRALGDAELDGVSGGSTVAEVTAFMFDSVAAINRRIAAATGPGPNCHSTANPYRPG